MADQRRVHVRGDGQRSRATRSRPTPYFSDNYWKHPSNPATRCLRSRRAVRRAVRADAVPRDVPREGGFGRRSSKDLPVEYRYVKDLYFGDKRMELNVVPAFSVRRDAAARGLSGAPRAARPVEPRDVFVSVTNGTKGAADATVALEVAAGLAGVAGRRADRFRQRGRIAVGAVRRDGAGRGQARDYAVHAVVTRRPPAPNASTSGYQAIEYPHVERRQVMKPAETSMKVIDVKTVASIKVGYVMGVGDQVPPAIEQLGGTLTMIDRRAGLGRPVEVRRHHDGRRAPTSAATDLRAYNRRAARLRGAGGTVIVQYNKTSSTSAAVRAVSRPGRPRPRGRRDRAGQGAPARRSRFNFPNKIGRGDVGGLGAGARSVFPRREGSALRRPGVDGPTRLPTTRA